MLTLWKITYNPDSDGLDVKVKEENLMHVADALATAPAFGPGSYRVTGPDGLTLARVTIMDPAEELARRNARLARGQKKKEG